MRYCRNGLTKNTLASLWAVILKYDNWMSEY